MRIYSTISVDTKLLKAGLATGILRQAIKKKLLYVHVLSLLDFVHVFNAIEDRPFGGGAGMLLKYQPIASAIKVLQTLLNNYTIVYLSPTGIPFNQEIAYKLSQKNIILLCGKYEGIDQRIIDDFVEIEISIGNYVVSCGEIAALVVLDSMARLIPRVLNNKESLTYESFQNNLLDCPHYTRPAFLPGSSRPVPPVLLSGNHKAILDWRIQARKRLTKEKRPDLLK
jgi:tRNA (guanine37-N1)-methyltransferase